MTGSAASKLRQRLFVNLGLKLTSLVIAFLLWLAVSSSPQTEVTLSVPIELRNVADGLEVTSDNVLQAQLRLRGLGRVIRDLRSEDMRITLDLSSFSPNTAVEHVFDLSSQQVRVPTGVEVLQVVPSYLRLGFDRRAERKVEIKPRVTGSFAPGYKISSITVSPSSMTVVGPEKRLIGMESPTTDPIDASGMTGSQTFLVTAHIQDPLLRFAQPASVRVTVVTEKTK